MRKLILISLILLFALVSSPCFALNIEIRNNTPQIIRYYLHSVDHLLKIHRPAWVFGGEIGAKETHFLVPRKHNQPPYRYQFRLEKCVEGVWEVSDCGVFTIPPDKSYWLIEIKEIT
ncbi:MAG: hypothetical protein KAH06_05420 [Desulfobacterales bacterium]|nr:hypothetical protein [Desulfobacterales bacterium]